MDANPRSPDRRRPDDRRRPRSPSAPPAALGKTIGLVPTMGALHQPAIARWSQPPTGRPGSSSSRSSSIPTQFGAGRGPRRPTRGPSTPTSPSAGPAGPSLVFAPSVHRGLPDRGARVVRRGARAWARSSKGRAAPGHFRGVATVVLKLVQHGRPRRRLLRRKGLSATTPDPADGPPTSTSPSASATEPTIREPDGLAMSSRNRYLDLDRASRPRRSSAVQAPARGSGGGRRGRAGRRPGSTDHQGDSIESEPRVAGSQRSTSSTPTPWRRSPAIGVRAVGWSPCSPSASAPPG